MIFNFRYLLPAIGPVSQSNLSPVVGSFVYPPSLFLTHIVGSIYRITLDYRLEGILLFLSPSTYHRNTTMAESTDGFQREGDTCFDGLIR